jgi:uncharacterized membrane protein YadS
MIVDTRPGETNVELLELEALWQTPAVEPEPKRRWAEPVTRFVAERGWRVLTIAWPLVILSLLLAPTSGDESVVPWYGWALFGAHLLALVGMVAAALGSFGSPVKWSLTAASLGVGLGVGCMTTGHHASGYAIYEFGAFCALTLLSAGTLAAKRAGAKRR